MGSCHAFRRIATKIEQNPKSHFVCVDCNNSPGAKLIHAAVDMSVSDIVSPTYVPLVVQSFFDHDRAINYKEFANFISTKCDYWKLAEVQYVWKRVWVRESTYASKWTWKKFDGKISPYPGREGEGSVDIEICLPLFSMNASFESDEEIMAAVSAPI
ncbi:hypothetical protein PVK06_018712 [Gossypium arboreum]|uniref:Uncharacterized protein n=1 Tax=Gossypium arboreum TaxID=29729 RepID=A0ABR0PHX1_GOSAR|nr:hypothetical protein PVK06_018712 [Gossypium arboreum]